MFGDGVSMGRSEGQGPEDREVERALEKFASLQSKQLAGPRSPLRFGLALLDRPDARASREVWKPEGDAALEDAGYWISTSAGPPWLAVYRSRITSPPANRSRAAWASCG